MNKRILALVLALCMVFTLMPMSVMAQQGQTGFTDVEESAFFYEPVLWAVEEGITNGMTDTTFGPFELCNRAHIITFLWRANGSPKATTVVNPFMDVKEGDFYYDAVLWALENGITNGTAEYIFGATEPCTRAQAVSFLYRAEGKPAYTTENPFTDVAEGTFYYDAALWALENGITTGATADTFNPDGTCSRAEIVTFLFRHYSKIDLAAVEAAADAYWADLDNQLKTGAKYPQGAEGMGAVVLAIKDGEVILNKAYGYAHYYDAAEGSDYWNPTYVKTANPREMKVDTMFDLASVTKVMATTQTIMLLVDRGQLDVNDKVSKYWPEFTGDGKENITVAQLLTHSSGLPQWEATFLYCDTHEEQMKYIEGLKIVPEYRTDGGEPKYSDFSFMTLAFLAEKITGVPMEQFVQENIYEPLGMTRTTYVPLENGFTKEDCAATSLGNPYEYRMVDEENFNVGYDCNKDVEAFKAFTGWRNYTLIGEVNDGNCGMGGGGIAGHAGLFSTASDLGILLQCMLDGGKYIDADGNEAQLYSEETVKLFTTKHTCYAENHGGSLSEEFGYGFKLDQSWMGKSATENVFGHDGFTGTTVFADPDNDYIFVCLTNKMQCGFRTATSNNYYNTNSWVSWNMNQAIKDVLGI